MLIQFEMTVEETIQQTMPMRCFGRNSEGKNALPNPVSFDLVIIRRVEDPQSIYISAENCPYITGSDKQRCKASYPSGVDKIGLGIICPCTISVPGGVEYLLSQMNKSG